MILHLLYLLQTPSSSIQRQNKGQSGHNSKMADGAPLEPTNRASILEALQNINKMMKRTEKLQQKNPFVSSRSKAHGYHSPSSRLEKSIERHHSNSIIRNDATRSKNKRLIQRVHAQANNASKEKNTHYQPRMA